MTALACSALALTGARAAAADGRGPEVFLAVRAGPPDATALVAPSGAALRLDLRLVNHGRAPLKLSLADAVLPELVDGPGRIVAFDYGANMGRAIRPGDEAVIPDGGSAALPVAGRLRLRGQDLIWSGADGVMGLWRIACADSPYKLRFRVHPSSGPDVVSASLPLPVCSGAGRSQDRAGDRPPT